MLFAIVALFANNGLLPTLHFAAAVPLATEICGAAAHHHDDAGAGQEGDGGGHSSADHQVCHFCRLIGAALPPPPDTLLAERPIESVRLGFSRHEPIEPPSHFLVGHPARAPPPLLA